jgi:hypothetical protein
MKVMHMDELWIGRTYRGRVVVMVEKRMTWNLRDADYILHKYTKTERKRKYQQTAEQNDHEHEISTLSFIYKHFQISQIKTE